MPYRYATGEVKGKYGYYDDTGSLREVEYGATPKGGFEPSGTGLVNPAQTAQQVPVQQVRQQQQQQETVDVNGRRASVVRRPRPEGTDRRTDVAVRRNKVTTFCRNFLSKLFIQICYPNFLSKFLSRCFFEKKNIYRHF